MNQTFKTNPKVCVKLLYDVSLTDEDIERLDKEHQSWRQNRELQKELFTN